MCGVVGCVENGRRAPQIVIEGLREVESRGYDSHGVCYEDEVSSRLVVEKNVGRIPKSAESNAKPSEIGLGHTRWATHGGVTRENAHPHLDCTGRIAVAHNGQIENHKELKIELKSAGHEGVDSDLDTLVVAHLVEDELKRGHDLLQAVGSVFPRFTGLNAILVTNGKDIVGAKNGAPLAFAPLDEEIGLSGWVIASDARSFAGKAKRACFLNNNTIVRLNGTAEMRRLPDMEELDIKYLDISQFNQKEDLGNYPYFMAKEIDEQPKVILKTLDQKDLIMEVAESLKGANRLFITGCGTAYLASLIGSRLFAEFANTPVFHAPGSEMSPYVRLMNPGDKSIILSQSGETADIIEMVQQALDRGVDVTAFLNVYGSTLHRMATRSVLLNAGAEKGVLATKSMTAKIAMLCLLSAAMGGDFSKGEKIVRESAEAVCGVLDRGAHIKELAEEYTRISSLYVMGLGYLDPVAKEAALKIKESSYIHAEGFAARELKHGNIALFEEGTPALIFTAEGENYEPAISSAQQVRARGGIILGVGPRRESEFNHFFEIPSVGIDSAIPSIVFAQKLAYHITLLKGLNPDMPRNLAKSVTVK